MGAALRTFAQRRLPVPPRVQRARLRLPRTGRAETRETTLDVERITQFMLVSQARYLSAVSRDWLDAALAAREQGGILLDLPEFQPLARERHLLELAQALAASNIVGRLRTRQAAEKVSGQAIEKPLAFAETFPRNLPPERVIAWIQSLPVVERRRWEAFVRQHQTAAFTLQGVNKREMLERMRDLVGESLRAGLTPAQVERQARDLLRDYQVTGKRLRLLWNDTVSDGVNRSRLQELADPEIRSLVPFMVFDAINDRVVRPNHLALDNAVAPVEWWQGAGRNFQPRLGFNCRCRLLAMTRAAAERLARSGGGYRIDIQGPRAGAGPDPNFFKAV